MLSYLVNQKSLFCANLSANVTIARAENGIAGKCCRFYFYFLCKFVSISVLVDKALNYME